MRLPITLSEIGPRISAGAFILNSGLGKRGADERHRRRHARLRRRHLSVPEEHRSRSSSPRPVDRRDRHRRRAADAVRAHRRRRRRADRLLRRPARPLPAHAGHAQARQPRPDAGGPGRSPRTVWLLGIGIGLLTRGTARPRPSRGDRRPTSSRPRPRQGRQGEGQAAIRRRARHPRAGGRCWPSARPPRAARSPRGGHDPRRSARNRDSSSVATGPPPERRRTFQVGAAVRHPSRYGRGGGSDDHGVVKARRCSAATPPRRRPRRAASVPAVAGPSCRAPSVARDRARRRRPATRRQASRPGRRQLGTQSGRGQPRLARRQRPAWQLAGARSARPTAR